MEIMLKTMAKNFPLEIFCNPNYVLKNNFVFDVLKQCDGAWLHNGNPEDPHAELTKGACSNGFFNCLKALKYVNLLTIFAYHLARKIREEIGNQRIDWVIGSPMAAIAFAYEMARQLGAPIAFFTDKNPGGGMLFEREKIGPDAYVLQIEELITTTGTTNDVKDAIDKAHDYPINWVPVVGALLLRPSTLPMNMIGDRKLVSLFEKEVWKEEPPCRLCKQGSERLKAKSNWDILTQN